MPDDFVLLHTVTRVSNYIEFLLTISTCAIAVYVLFYIVTGETKYYYSKSPSFVSTIGLPLWSSG